MDILVDVDQASSTDPEQQQKTRAAELEKLHSNILFLQRCLQRTVAKIKRFKSRGDKEFQVQLETKKGLYEFYLSENQRQVQQLKRELTAIESEIIKTQMTSLSLRD